MVGRKISHYKITEKLGEGGMGVVYKAEDTQLRRIVALKFLSSETVGNEEVKARLIREAQASASLDHPNICAVHGIHEEQGQTFIAMAYIDGPALADKIKERPLPLGEALGFAIQIAEGLQEAHEKGIVHRDIKPHNVMLTANGQVKIMDFGLASLAGRSKLTKSGTTLGTPAYMAPEQLEGQQADRRADVWALGCVLYEMLTEKTPFDAEYEQAIAYGILNEEPEPVSALRSGLPLQIDNILAKALAKDREQRYQHADDLLVDLRALHGTPRTAPPPRSKRRIPVAALLASALAGAGLYALLAPPPEPDPPAVYRFEVPQPPGYVIRSFEVSPDGSSLAFVAQQGEAASLWLRVFSEPAPRMIARTGALDPLGVPFWSPDSRNIGFFADRMLKKVSVGGGPPVELADAPQGRTGSWNADGRILFSPRSSGVEAFIYVVAESGGDAVPTEASQAIGHGLELTHRSPFFLPNGERYLFHNRGAAGSDRGEIRLARLGEPESVVLTRSKSHATMLRLGSEDKPHVLTERGGVLLAHALNADEGAIAEEGLPIAEGIGYDLGISRSMFSAPPSGVLAYLPEAEGNLTVRELVWTDREGNVVRNLASDKGYTEVRISPGGSRAAVVAKEAARSFYLPVTLFNLDDGRSMQPVPTQRSHSAVWSADGESLLQVFLRDLDTYDRAIYRVAADGSGEPREFVNAPSPVFSLNDRSPDGKWLLVTSRTGAQADRNLLVVDAGSGQAEPFLATPAREYWGRFSSDGSLVAYTSDESGAPEIYVRSFPDGGAKQRVSMTGGSIPVWRQDGRELLFVSPRAEIMAAEIIGSGPERTFGAPRALFAASNQSVLSETSLPGFDVSADGNRFLITRQVEEAVPTPISVVINWDQELREIMEAR